MSHMNRQPHTKHEVKSKIGDYIRGKISAQSLMHPSRINTKPINRSRFNLNTNAFNYQISKTEYQRKARRPPLKDYIEGKVKLSDMISPSKITYIPKEKKYQAENKRFMSDMSDDEFTMDSGRCSTDEAIKIVTHVPPDPSKEEHWSLANYQDTSDKAIAKNEITLIPIKSTTVATNGTRKRKLMCKVKVQHNINNALTYGQIATERIIEIPEGLLRDTNKIPKFLMDRYNIPCYVSAGNPPPKRKRPLAISNDDSQDEVLRSTGEQINVENEGIEAPNNIMQIFANFENSIGEGENSLTELAEKKNSVDIENVPLEQGDYNNSTTVFFEFFEEDAQPEMEGTHAIIEEVIEDNTQRYDKDERRKRDMRINPETPSSERFPFEDYKSNIYFQREIIDLQMGMLKCDKNVMLVERNVNQVTASLNMLENIINQEIRPFVINIKTDNHESKIQIQSLRVGTQELREETQELQVETQQLEAETQELKKNVKYLRKKFLDYDKLLQVTIRQNYRQNWKIKSLENRLLELKQAQITTIQLTRNFNKDIMKQMNSYGEKEMKNFSE